MEVITDQRLSPGCACYFKRVQDYEARAVCHPRSQASCAAVASRAQTRPGVVRTGAFAPRRAVASPDGREHGGSSHLWGGSEPAAWPCCAGSGVCWSNLRPWSHPAAPSGFHGGGATCKAVPDVSTAQAGPEQAHATAACVVAHATEVGGEGARLEGGGVATCGELGQQHAPVRRARVLRSGAGTT